MFTVQEPAEPPLKEPDVYFNGLKAQNLPDNVFVMLQYFHREPWLQTRSSGTNEIQTNSTGSSPAGMKS